MNREARKCGLYAAILAATLCFPAMAADYLGTVTSVADGDTFTMEAETGRVRVRICGIDAPERGQPGYGQAAGVLANLVEGKIVHCLQVGEGTPCDGKSKPISRDRIVAQCFLDKLDIAEEMTKSGTACDWAKFSGGHYKISDSTCSRK
ncbi:thermonuclease family protein [Bradyrhizobium erythrophlei]|jgi:endonuclease YncB( thermonuclease family)|uniref:Nuclease homologue n=1 Tax=Bradyrhizobium erythrophlei TaxID=1437360 RepID=A0A1M5RHU7_9BRAD|nr:thermonuclease family protein [Bradyrhizobium erythrophlei]SHH25821.1 nuclease homologue [Bradyrhizobium erythrophlei]